ncbi:molybdopterin biosynthesis protein [Methanococcus voltae]|uniref:Putative molybdopterin biosynthesis protein n=1 Tax=Methanococcus voltae TaxID=2188 RepID=A0A8J7S4D6_METVO|nr:molybdopterin biosynthesis protein [Methanococcus voltae]MBP2171877.1 putative molybdopterin biosynthesis protein [Methanococcus voltae]MBP2201168.1 putative molybdopterin biosynthesis protein [Methanococcus voltae]
MRYLELLEIKDAKKIIMDKLSELQNEEIDLIYSNGRILSDDIVSAVDVPPFDRSRMDGYAVLAKDTYEADESNPITLKVIDSVKAGAFSDKKLTEKTCIEIATGAPMPKSADAVVMVEYTEQIAENEIKIYDAVAPHENIQYCGSDIMVGELILRKGTKLTARDIGAISAIGMDKIKVEKSLNVGLISTGNELQELGDNLKPNKIYDVNTYTLASSIQENGWNFNFYGIVGDNKIDLKEKITNALNKDEDVIILSGGTSAGVGDLTSTVIEELGGEILVHGIKIKPGKPTIIGQIPYNNKHKLVVGLPGYPTSCLTIFDVLFNEKGNLLTAHFHPRYISAKGREEYLPVSIIKGLDGYGVYPIVKGSGAITSLTYADGYVIIPENKEMLEDEVVDVHLFGNIKLGLNIIGSHCVGIDYILQKSDLIAKTINVGSLGGISSIKREEADIAGIHLLGNDGEYNIPFLKRYGVKNASLVRGYLREQGFIFKKELVEKVGFELKTIEDVLKLLKSPVAKEIDFINRNKGAGTRVLFDKFLKDNKINKSNVNGYDLEAKTHSAVGASIATDKVDMGVGIKTIAEKYNLEFIKLADENYDLLIRNEKINDPEVLEFIELLKKVELPFKKPNDCGEIIYKSE